jgi:hypothetical protein
MIYRDRKTGRFASRATWKRSHARGSRRYVREKPKPKQRAIRKVPARVPESPRRRILYEWLVVWTYRNTGKAVGFIATAYNADDALRFVERFLRKTKGGRAMLESFDAWNTTIARGKKSSHEEGLVETRENR